MDSSDRLSSRICHFSYPCGPAGLVFSDVCAALVHTVGLIAAHTVHAVQTSQEQRVIRFDDIGNEAWACMD